MVRSAVIKTIKISLGISLLAFSWNAQAASLGLTLADSPDIASGFITVSYDAASDTLSASGFALQYDDGTDVIAIVGGLYTLEANIDGSGNLIGGSFSISGSLGTHSAGVLLTGTLTDFGFPDAGGDPLEFLFDTTGGLLASAYGVGGGIILSFAGFDGDFHDNFQNNGTGVSDVANIPVPAALWLMLSAMGGLVGLRRRKS